MTRDGGDSGDDRTVTFLRDGRKIRARPDQTVGGALYAHGDRTFSRSLKYHRPRGWACGTGDCNNCMMRVDGMPNVKVCQTPVREGMVVEGQNAWPSVRRDIFRGADLTFRKELDHHRWFVRPHFLYGLFGRVIRAFAGWGRLPETEPEAPAQEVLRPDVAVVGGGPAGLAAARAAAEAGATVLLLERSARLGGQAAHLARPVPDPEFDGPAEDRPAVPMADLVARWSRAVTDDAAVDVRTDTALGAAYRNGLCIAQSTDTLTLFRPKALVAATGTYAEQALFPNNDLPGVMDASACAALLHREGVAPGRRAVVYGAGAHGLHIARDLHDAGIEVACVAAPGPYPVGPEEDVIALESDGVPVETRTTLVKAHGFGRVKAVTVHGRKGKKRIRCDLVVVAVGRKTAPELFQGLGARLVHDPSAGGAVPLVDPVLGTSLPGLFAAGDTAGVGSLATARWSGRLAGLAAARHAGHDLGPLAHTIPELQHELALAAAVHGGPAQVRLDEEGREKEVVA